MISSHVTAIIMGLMYVITGFNLLNPSDRSPKVFYQTCTTKARYSFFMESCLNISKSYDISLKSGRIADTNIFEAFLVLLQIIIMAAFELKSCTLQRHLAFPP